MPYTLWSKGRLLGHTDLGFIANTAVTKMGWFHPTDVGEQVLDIVMEPSRVMHDYRNGGDLDTLHADLNAAGDRVEALELELRSPEGDVMETRDIGINDTERLLALAAECEAEQDEEDFLAGLEDLAETTDADVELMRFDDLEDGGDGAPWEEPDYPRYQILVFL